MPATSGSLLQTMTRNSYPRFAVPNAIWVLFLATVLSNGSAAVEGVKSAVMDHSHMPITVPESSPSPSLSLILHKDLMSGFNLRLVTENFRMMPPPVGLTDMGNAMGASTDEYGVIEGHAHLYINGEKIQRLYGYDVHLPASQFHAGINQISVSINNHGHMYWSNNGRQVIATLFIAPDKEQSVRHRFESFPITDAR